MCDKGRPRGSKRGACGPASPIRTQISESPSKQQLQQKEITPAQNAQHLSAPLDLVSAMRDDELLLDDDEPKAAQTRVVIGGFVAPSTNEPHFTADRANPVKCPRWEVLSEQASIQSHES